MIKNFTLYLFCIIVLSVVFQGCKKEVIETTTVTARKGLVLRSGPGIDSPKKTVIPYKEKVGIIAYSNKISVIGRKTAPWVEVRYKGQEGWVFSGFLASYVPQEQDDLSRVGKFVSSPFKKDIYPHAIGPDVKKSILKNISGTPEIKTVEEKNIHDPSIVDKTYTMVYPGITFTIYHATKLKKQIIQGIVITDGTEPLKYGIKSGMTPAEITSILGPPTENKNNNFYYRTRDALPAEAIFSFEKNHLKKIILAYPVE